MPPNSVRTMLRIPPPLPIERKDALRAAGVPRGAARRSALHALAIDRAAVLNAARGEHDLVAPHPALLHRQRLALGAQRTGEHLELLLERKLALRQLPAAADLRRHDPE